LRRNGTRPHKTFLSLFSGCGGLDLGFIAAGFTPTQGYELDPSAAATYRRNIASDCIQSDLTAWLQLVPVFGSPDVVIAGPPCQGFSLAGQRLPDDPRNSLLAVPARVAAAINSRAVVIENVLGVLSPLHKQYWDEAISVLTAAGFGTRTVTIEAQSVGLPQLRKRVFLIGIRDRIPAAMPSYDFVPVPLSSVLPVPAGTPNHTPVPLEGGTRAHRIAVKIAPGQKLCNVRAGETAVHTWDIPNVFGVVNNQERDLLSFILRRRRQARRRARGDADPVDVKEIREQYGAGAELLIARLVHNGYLRNVGRHYVDLTHTFNGKFRRLHPDEPTHCVMTRFCDPSYFLHPYEHRGFTVREAARIQGFSDSFVFDGTPSAQARQVGNAVPPPLAKRVAEFVLDQLV
jgi:DNA (cytosine-5)-methyltransferase 1